MTYTTQPPSETVSEDFGSYQLPGQLRRAAPSETKVGTGDVPLLALHGARSDGHRWHALLQPLQALGVGSLAPSLSGHGPQTPVPLEQTSLANNLQEAERFAARLGPQLRMVMGSSMGGALAMRVAERHAEQVEVLVLCGPALYPEAAWQAAHFGAPFTEAISTPFGFLDSASLDFLRRFKGQLVLIQGEYDGLQATDHGAPPGRSAGEVRVHFADGSTRKVRSPIPAEVLQAIAEAAGPHLLRIVLQGADHRLADHLQQHPAVAQTLATLLHASLQAAPTYTTARRISITLQGEIIENT